MDLFLKSRRKITSILILRKYHDVINKVSATNRDFTLVLTCYEIEVVAIVIKT